MDLSELDIDFNKKLGSGYIASVYLAHHKITKQKYAVKVVNWDQVSK